MEHGRIESRTCRIFREEELIVDKEKWGGNLTVIEILISTEKKSDGKSASEQRLYIASIDSTVEYLSLVTRWHWVIESMNWDLDCNLKRKTERVVRNLDAIQRVVLALFTIGKNKRKKMSDKSKGTAEIARELSFSFTKLLHLLDQK